MCYGFRNVYFYRAIGVGSGKEDIWGSGVHSAFTFCLLLCTRALHYYLFSTVLDILHYDKTLLLLQSLRTVVLMLILQAADTQLQFLGTFYLPLYLIVDVT